MDVLAGLSRKVASRAGDGSGDSPQVFYTESYSMLFTSLAAIAAASGLATGLAPSASPQWQPDYPTAVRTAAAQHKPLAVFVGHGQAGFAQLVSDGGPAAEATKALGEKFVSVYVDADSANGKPLAAALKVTDGLVISDHTGTLAALRHQGAVHPVVLTSYVSTYAVEQPVVQTVQAGTLAPVAPAGGMFADRPLLNAVTAPMFNTFGAVRGMMGGGCPNGNCGGGRPMYFR